MTQFKVGDKVKLKHHGIIGWENKEWTFAAHLVIGREYTISAAFDDVVSVEEDPIRFEFHPDHFTLSTTNTHDKQ